MNTLVTKIKNLPKRLLAFIPTPLPTGCAAYQKWSTDVIRLYGLPENDSVRWALSMMVINVEGTKTKPAFYIPKRYFGLSLRKAAANEVAHNEMVDLKEKQKAAIETKKQAEAAAQTTLTVVAGNESKPV